MLVTINAFEEKLKNLGYVSPYIETFRGVRELHLRHSLCSFFFFNLSCVLTDNTENILEWHQRYSIAIGTAKGLRFLHEECRGSPIIHRDMRPGNILLTHDFVPMVNLHTP